MFNKLVLFSKFKHRVGPTKTVTTYNFLFDVFSDITVIFFAYCLHSTVRVNNFSSCHLCNEIELISSVNNLILVDELRYSIKM